MPHPGYAQFVGPEEAALANGVAAHALDFDDMCFVSLAHPSCALVPAALATAELVQASGSAIVDAYAVGFELECRLGNVMNPRHYHERGWHCTSSIGTLGAAAAAARILGLDIDQTRHALGIAASSACGLKENIGTMVKPLHAGLAARNGVMAARLAREGFAASARALDGPQGYLAVMDSQGAGLDDAVADLGARWEILETGITVKLYPCCAATHPPLDALIELRRRESITPDEVDTIDVEVDSMTPRLLIYDRPATGLEAKFSMPFCAAAAIVHGRLVPRSEKHLVFFPAFDELGVAMPVAPRDVRQDRPAAVLMIRIVGVGQREIADAREDRFDPIQPRGVGRREDELHVVVGGPVGHLASLVRREVVEHEVEARGDRVARANVREEQQHFAIALAR